MKTTIKNLVINEDLAKKFKKSYSVKMGGTQTIQFPCGSQFYFDDKQYYSGRGAKYNNSIKHQDLGLILVSKKDLKKYIDELNEQNKYWRELKKEETAKNKRILQAKKQGIYSISKDNFIELSDFEYQNNIFDIQRLAATLKISIKDAELLKSYGKTYVFAKSEDGNVYELYHSDLSCNNLSIYVGVATPERIAEFKPAEWQNHPFGYLVGQTKNENHFVC